MWLMGIGILYLWQQPVLQLSDRGPRPLALKTWQLSRTILISRAYRFSSLAPWNLLSFNLAYMLSLILSSSSFSSSSSSPFFYCCDSEFLPLLGLYTGTKLWAWSPTLSQELYIMGYWGTGAIHGRNTHAKTLNTTDRIIRWVHCHFLICQDTTVLPLLSLPGPCTEAGM